MEKGWGWGWVCNILGWGERDDGLELGLGENILKSLSVVRISQVSALVKTDSHCLAL